MDSTSLAKQISETQWYVWFSIVAGIASIIALLIPNFRIHIMNGLQKSIEWIYCKFGDVKIRKIQSHIHSFIESEDGKKYLANNSNKELKKKLLTSIKALKKHKNTTQFQEDVYYLYLFSLLEKAKDKIWAASISDPLEWTDSEEEKLFLKLNIKASERRILVERIFIIDKAQMQDFLAISPIKEQIKQHEKSEYYYTYYAYKEDIDVSLLRDIASGFLAFDDLAIAKDVFSDKEIRGIIEIESFLRHNKIFTKLRTAAHPLDSNYYKTITGTNLND